MNTDTAFALLLYGLALIIGITWVIFPFIVAGQLSKIIDLLKELNEDSPDDSP